MGKFFNKRIMNARMMPGDMEDLRKRFNEEQRNGQPIRSQTTQTAGTIDTEVGNKRPTKSAVSTRRRRQKRTRRTN